MQVRLKNELHMINCLYFSIMQFFEKGIVHKLKTKWWKKNRLCQKQRTSEGLRLTQTAGVFIATGGFYVFGLLILILEVLISVFCRKRKDKAYLHNCSTSNTTLCTIESNTSSIREPNPVEKHNRPSTTETRSDDTGVYSQASSTFTNGNWRDSVCHASCFSHPQEQTDCHGNTSIYKCFHGRLHRKRLKKAPLTSCKPSNDYQTIKR